MTSPPAIEFFDRMFKDFSETQLESLYKDLAKRLHTKGYSVPSTVHKEECDTSEQRLQEMLEYKQKLLAKEAELSQVKGELEAGKQEIGKKDELLTEQDKVMKEKKEQEEKEAEKKEQEEREAEEKVQEELASREKRKMELETKLEESQQNVKSLEKTVKELMEAGKSSRDELANGSRSTEDEPINEAGLAGGDEDRKQIEIDRLKHKLRIKNELIRDLEKERDCLETACDGYLTASTSQRELIKASRKRSRTIEDSD
jgi:chromosome segregation ATPase